ncbi:hypothetical protein CI109_101032 [Kwoniella shandongensis]|uniref:Uncharacterized protein n=1 Tax=Kwoniella shandongensis TaxID=1734106 RepID=A0A5M6C4J9_9TREE|nr:uncharacterized protein CI109_001501 [Kwoniella shandongensis]KAA5530097.1 hypothetical protein CI109_001501 [Kwoniella shandongensis]
MYWYISFLRPPPVSVSSTAEGITITPQVANDLRTELRFEPTPIHYQWQRLLPTPSQPLPSQVLTTFEPPASTYKPLHIPLPPKVQLNEQWRLGLFSPSPSSSSSSGTKADAGAGPSSALMDLASDHHPGQPLGVWSEGITIVRPDISSTAPNGAIRGIGSEGKGKGGKSRGGGTKDGGKGKGKEKDDMGPKQGRITRDWTLPGDSGKYLKIVEQTSFDLDKKIWDSGLALSAWLFRYLLPSTSVLPHTLGKRVIDLLTSEQDLRVVELGSGTGLVSIALGLTLQDVVRAMGKREITATDLESAIPLMDENLTLNDLSRDLPAPVDKTVPEVDDEDDESMTKDPIQGGRVHVDARVLDWDQSLPSWVEERWPELIIAADVTYNTSAFPSLLKTLTSLLLPSTETRSTSSREPPLLVLAYKQRDEAERELWSMLKEKGVEMVLVDTIVGAEQEGKVEIWVGGTDLGRVK